jgi:hypothetical protein
MTNLPKDPKDKDPKKISPTRIALWVLVAGFGLYYVISGIVGMLQHR